MKTIKELRARCQKFVDNRNWNQFHNPRNLAANISVEAAELLEIFTWTDAKKSFEVLESERNCVEDELADILFATLCFANAANIDLETAFDRKVTAIEQKYMPDKCKAGDDSYDAYREQKKEFNRNK